MSKNKKLTEELKNFKNEEGLNNYRRTIIHCTDKDTVKLFSNLYKKKYPIITKIVKEEIKDYLTNSIDSYPEDYPFKPRNNANDHVDDDDYNRVRYIMLKKK